MTGDGVPEFAALAFRTRDAATIERVRRSLFALGYDDPYGPGYEPVESYGAYSTFMIVPEGHVVSVDGIHASVVAAAQVAYANGATRVQVWAEDVDQVIPWIVEDPAGDKRTTPQRQP